jgi:pyruvate kinase
MKKTKIVATIGPASMTKVKLRKMVEAGMDICRLNFSHSDHLWHKKVIKNIREVERDVGKKIGILADLQGPRIRVANEEEFSLKKGGKILVTDESGKRKSRRKNKLIFDWDGFWQYLRKGNKIFIEDGLIQLEVVRLTSFGCLAEVKVAGVIKPHKAVNIPAISNRMNFLTDKDLADLEFALKERVDMIAASFVGGKKDLHQLRKLIDYFLEYRRPLGVKDERQKRNYYPWVISKVERSLAIKNLRDIIAMSDGIMIARGDLAVEMPQEKVALLELDILKKTRRAHKPVVVATQMLASMEINNRPTRAEITDVTNAVVNHTDAVMLSGETAMGRYPVLTVQTMSDIIQVTERSAYNDIKLRKTKLTIKLFGKRNKKRRQVKTAQSLEELLRYSSWRQENLRLKLSRRKKEDWGKASLIWGVDVRGF